MDSSGGGMDSGEGGFEGGQTDCLQALRSASLPDDFWMYSYKVLPCPHGYRHSWTHCPFSHCGETARRRCPRTHQYLPDPCPNARAKRQCPNGDACPYAHNTFEQWLHPSRYRTRLCYLGANCRRPTCFFAHSVDELRSVDEDVGPTAGGAPTSPLQLPPLPIPPPLPSPSGGMLASGHGCDQTNQGPSSQGHGAPPMSPAMMPSPLMRQGSVAAASAAAAGHMLQPVALMCMPAPPPQQQQGMQQRGDMGPHGHGPMAFRAGMPVVSQLGQAGLQGPGPMAMAPMHPHHAAQLQHQHMTQMAAAHGHGPMHLTAMHAAPIYMAAAPRGMSPLPAGTPMGHHPHAHYMASPYGAHPAAGPTAYYHAAGGAGGGAQMVGQGGVNGLGSVGRARSWSTPGEALHSQNGGGPASGGSNQGPSSFGSSNGDGQRGGVYGMGGGGGSGTYGPSDFSGHRAAGLPPGVVAGPVPQMMGMVQQHGAGRGGPVAAAAAPRHMPAPTNRGGATMRRMSTPASTPATAAAAAATAAAAAAAAAMRHHPGGPAAAVSSPFVGGGGAASHHLLAQSSSGVEASLRQLSLTAPVPAMQSAPAATPPSHLIKSPVVAAAGSAAAAGTSPVSAPLTSSAKAALYDNLSQVMASHMSSPGGATTPSELSGDSPAASTVTSSQLHAAVDDGSVSVTAARRAPAPASSTGAADDAVAAFAAAAAAAAADDGSDSDAAAAAAAMPYHALLQHVLRSASASAAEGPNVHSGNLDALLSGAAAAAGYDYDDEDGNADDGDVLDGDRSSDPNPRGLRAAIRRLSTEVGAAAMSRHSDPGQVGGGAGSGNVSQLLPLLQVVLTEGLATGQFELVNGQLQVKGGGAIGSRDPSFTKGVAAPGVTSAAVAVSGSVGGSPRVAASASSE